jgi:16S rRNA (uracil1498-N3)-methyltransferase
MPRRRFHIPPGCIDIGSAVLPPDQAHHVRDVLRLRCGDELELFDGAGNAWTGTVESAGREVRITGMKPLPAEAPGSPLALAVALFKPARFEWMLEKATELGVDEFIPLETRYTEVLLAGGGVESRLARWARIVRQACEQCGRNRIPRIRGPVLFEELLTLKDYSGYTRLICRQRSEGALKSERFGAGPTALCIGPEGGWAEDEIEAARSSGCLFVSLGSHTLRAETAALAAVTLVRIGSGDLRVSSR